MTTLLPAHGHIGCRSCFPGPGQAREFSNTDGSRWRIEQPNAAFGSRSPVVLVLGFSKGATQSKPGLTFDEIAFKGMRGQLSAILASLKLLTRPIDQCVRANENRLAFGSLIRCSVAQWDTQKNSFSKSGSGILQKFSKGDETARVASNCVNAFLGVLPAPTKLVVMLGNEEKYVAFCRSQIAAARGDAAQVNAVAYDSKGVRFVHVIHAKAQGALVPDWLKGQGSQASKRHDATSAVAAWSAVHPSILETG